MRHKVIEIASGNDVKPGMRILDFRSEIWEFESFQVGSPPSEGKITVRKPGDESHGRLMYPSVFGLKIVEIDDVAK